MQSVQSFAHFLTNQVCLLEIGDSLLPLEDVMHVQQRLFKPAPKHTRTHAGHRAVNRPEQTALALLVPDGFSHFQIAAGVQIQGHVVIDLVWFDCRDVLRRLMLGFLQIND